MAPAPGVARRPEARPGWEVVLTPPSVFMRPSARFGFWGVSTKSSFFI